MPFPHSHPVPAARPYVEQRVIFDAQEACHLINRGWKLVELVETKRWSSGYRSESTTYTVGLPRPEVGAQAA